jgi:hypothetical protein
MRKLRPRIAEHPTGEFWAFVVGKIAASRFCRGDNPRGWRVTFDWLIENGTNCLKVTEGNYDDDRRTGMEKSRDETLGILEAIPDGQGGVGGNLRVSAGGIRAGLPEGDDRGGVGGVP